MAEKKDSVDLICSIAELSGLFERTDNLSDFLGTVVSMVAYHMNAAVCSVYLWDDDIQRLVLTANQGLNSDKIGQVRLALGEGLVGLAVKELRPICEANAADSPHFLYVPELEEEQYRSFLVVPILRGLNRLGALVVQDPQPDYFDTNDIKALQAISAQLAATIDSASLFLRLYQQEEDTRVEPPEPVDGASLPNIFKGVGISPGFVSGMANLVGPIDAFVDLSQNMPDADVTLEDFQKALHLSEYQLEALQSELEKDHADVSSLIFSAQLLMLKDSQFSGAMIEQIENGVPPAEAVSQIVGQYTQLFSSSNNVRLREKVQDVKDVGHRILLNLLQTDQAEPDYHDEILITGELLPSDIVKYHAQRAAGIVMVGGAAGSHVSILARSLDLPMVIMTTSDVFSIETGTQLLLDSEHGSLFVRPDAELMSQHESVVRSQRDAESLAEQTTAESVTKSGERMYLMANINLLSELRIANQFKAEGIGLYRSEFPFIVRNEFPSEEEQFLIYRSLFQRMENRPVVIRTLDIGGDKMLSYYPSVNEENPFLGLRALRFTLRNQEIFVQQLRAILRAGHGSDLRIMFPMVSSLDDFLTATDIVRDCQQQLAEAGIDHHEDPQFGPMIELPSAVEIMDELAQASDFLCVGTNDLVQYILGVDRTNEHIADMYVPYHPAVLRSLKRIVDAAMRQDTHISICGEMATDPRLLPFLVGIGVTTFSVNARWIPKTQERLAALTLDEAKGHAQNMLKLARLSDLKEYVEEFSKDA